MTRPRRLCAASAAANRSSATGVPATKAARSASSCSASRSSRSGPPGRTVASPSRVRTSSITASGRAPRRSSLLTKTSVGTPSRRSVRISTRVWACTPSTADTTSTAPSSTSSTRSTSAMKSGCPGVSIRLTAMPPTVNETTAERIVMPRRRSSASESVCVFPASTLPGSSMTPAAWRSRSVSEVLPASTCARIPRFKHCTARHVLREVRDGRGHARSGHGAGASGSAWIGSRTP